MKMKSFFKISIIYISFSLSCFFVFFRFRSIYSKLYRVIKQAPYILVISFSIMKNILFFSFLYLVIYLLISTPKIYKKFSEKEHIKHILSKPKSQVNINDLKIVFNYYKKENTFNISNSKIICNIISLIILTLMTFFLSAFIIEMICSNHQVPDQFSYIIILLFWTFSFTLFFLYNNILISTFKRDIFVYITLFILYIVTLLIKRGVFKNLVLFYNPYNNYNLNLLIQNYLYEQVTKYSEYIIDWTLIQSVILAILIHFNLGRKRFQKIIEFIETGQKEYLSLLEILNIIEQIFSDDQFKKLCIDISNKVKNDKFNLYKEKIINYHKQIVEVYPDIKDSKFIWIFDNFSISFFLNEMYMNEILNTSPQVKLHACNLCKKFFFSSSKDYICKDCNKRKIII